MRTRPTTLSLLRPRLPQLRLGALALTAATTLVLSACGQPAAPTSDPEPAATTPAADRTETEGAEPRLVVATGNSVVVLDAADRSEVQRLDVTGPPRLSLATDDRHVYLTQGEAGRVDVLDAGTWAAGHGDHFHFFTGTPALRDGMALTGAKPVHVVSADERTAIFFDDDGRGVVFADDGTLVGQFATTEVDGGGPHHGVAVPFGADRTLVTVAPPGEKPLPSSLRLLDAGGKEVKRYDDVCPELHGETVVNDTVVFGCGDHVALVDDTGASKVPYPEDAAEDRVGGLVSAPGSDIALGDFGDTTLALIDVAKRSLSTIDLGTTYGPRARTADGGHLALTTDGKLHVLAEDGTEQRVVDAIEPYTIGEGHGALAPTLAVVGDTVHITDPATRSLVSVDLTESKVVGTTDLGSEPSQVVAVNTAHAEDHDHEAHDHDDHE